MTSKEVYLDYLHHDTQTNTNQTKTITSQYLPEEVEIKNYMKMNSKEAFLKIESFCAYYLDEVGEALEKLAKDLEVLEILKNESDYKKIIEKDGIATFHLDMVLTQDTILKVKEWLNDK